MSRSDDVPLKLVVFLKKTLNNDFSFFQKNAFTREPGDKNFRTPEIERSV